MSANVAQTEKRRVQRISLPLPARIEVKIDQQVSWNEVSRLSDVSAYGAGFLLKRPLKRGRLISLTMPMPRQLRCFDHSDPQYRVWSLVRRCIPTRTAAGEMRYAIGVAFVGKSPPAEYKDDPSTLYEITHLEEEGLWQVRIADENQDQSNLAKDERRQTRFFIPETLKLDVLDAEGNISQSETTVTENISFGGAAVFTSINADPGFFVRVSSDRHEVKIIAVVRAKRMGPDGLTRLHLEFIDHFFPLEGIE